MSVEAMNDDTTADAVTACERIAIEAAIKNTAPLAYHDEYQAAGDAAERVIA